MVLLVECDQNDIKTNWNVKDFHRQILATVNVGSTAVVINNVNKTMMAVKLYLIKMAKKRAAETRQLFILVSESPILLILNSPKQFPMLGRVGQSFSFLMWPIMYVTEQRDIYYLRCSLAFYLYMYPHETGLLSKRMFKYLNFESLPWVQLSISCGANTAYVCTCVHAPGVVLFVMCTSLSHLLLWGLEKL